MTDSRAVENTGDAERPTAPAAGPHQSAPAEPVADIPDTPDIDPSAPGEPLATAPAAADTARARPASKIPPGVRLTLWLLLFGYCVYGVGFELSRSEPRLWVFALRGVVGLIAVVSAVSVYNEIRNRGRS
jgi:hypothetical protein